MRAFALICLEAAIREIEDSTVKVFVDLDPPGPPSRPKNDWHHHFPLKIFVDEIARIEREWQLV
jgi:hypothetical protein